MPLQHENGVLAAPNGQGCPHAPQLFGSVFRFTQAPLQLVVPVGQAQMPFVQLPKIGQAFPHAPQLFGSVFRFRQAPLQFVCPAGQAQTPFVQISPAGQDFPHTPQLFRSVFRFRQTPPQTMSPAGQAQTPFVQLPPTGQRLPHVPQFDTVPIFVHVPLQQTSPGRQHCWPHCPQLPESEFVSVHEAPQQLRPCSQQPNTQSSCPAGQEWLQGP
jgi:hypothetical protein